jgi:hypothetical protein
MDRRRLQRLMFMEGIESKKRLLLTMAARTIQKVLSTLMAFGMMACSLFLSKEARYLMSAKNRATETDVRRHLGEPLEAALTNDGHSKWTYETRTAVQQGTNNSWTTLESWRCDSYTAIFDEHHILRDWTHASRTCE